MAQFGNLGVLQGWAGTLGEGVKIGGQLLRPLAKGETPSLRTFYIKRAFRILPAFWAVLAVYLL